jgi:hypothetical protein
MKYSDKKLYTVIKSFKNTHLFPRISSIIQNQLPNKML